MSDKELIIRSLEKVERRIRSNVLFHELTFALAIALAIPVLFKILDLFRPFRGITVAVILILWLAGVLSYVAWKMSKKTTLTQTAAAIDHKAALRDEVKSAYWFVTSPQAAHRSTEWVALQVQRAARRVSQLNVEQLYPRVVPPASYIAGALIVLFIGLNFTPLSTSHNWVYLQAAPAFSLTAEEQKLIEQTKELLKRAENLGQPELVKKLEEIIQNLQAGNIDSAEAMRQLDSLKKMLGEGNLQMANINEGLDEMAEDLAGSPQTKDVSDAMSKHDLKETADQLKKLAEEPPNENDQEGVKALEDALKQASESAKPGMEDLAEDMKKAADSLANQDSEAFQEAMKQAAQDAEALQQKMEEQQAKNAASQDIQSLQDSLRQRQEQSQAQQGAVQQPQQGQAKEGKDGQPQDDAGSDPKGADAGTESSDSEPGAKQAQQPGKAGEAQGGDSGKGQNPSGAPQAPMDIIGAPTKLSVKLEQEKLAGENDGGAQQNLEESSKQERSKLDYRNVESELSPAQKDVLNQDKIPWEYKSLIKNYFQALRPGGK